MAPYRTTDAQAIRANGCAGQQRRARNRVRGCGRDVALELRYGARRVQRGTRPPMATGSAAVRFAACVRSLEARGKVWRQCSERRPADSGALAWQYVVAGLDEHLSSTRASQC